MFRQSRSREEERRQLTPRSATNGAVSVVRQVLGARMYSQGRAYPERGVPRGGGQRRAVGRQLHVRHAVLVAAQHAHARGAQCVPGAGRVVGVSGEQQPPAHRPLDRVDAEEDALLGVTRHLAVGAQVEQAAARVVRAGRQRVTGRVEAHGRHVRVVRVEGLHGLPGAHVPHEHLPVAGTRHERVAHLGRRQVDAHHVGGVRLEALQQLARLDVPQRAGAVAAARQDLPVRVGEQAARQVRAVRGDGALALPRLLALPLAQREHRHFVVQAPVTRAIVGSITFVQFYESPLMRQTHPAATMLPEGA